MNGTIDVSAAYLHQNPGCYPLPAERTLNQTKVPGIKMSWGPDGLFWEFKGAKGMMPASAVQCVIFAEPKPESKPTLKTVK